MEQQYNTEELKSFKRYSGKAPLALQIVGGFMWIGGLILVISGLFGLLTHWTGLIIMVVGILTILCAQGIFKLRRKVLVGSLLLTGLSAGMSFIYGVLESADQHEMFISAGVYFLFFMVIYLYRGRFTNA